MQIHAFNHHLIVLGIDHPYGFSNLDISCPDYSAFCVGFKKTVRVVSKYDFLGKFWRKFGDYGKCVAYYLDMAVRNKNTEKTPTPILMLRNIRFRKLNSPSKKPSMGEFHGVMYQYIFSLPLNLN